MRHPATTPNANSMKNIQTTTDDDLAADPIHDRPPARRNGGDADRLTALLDSLTVATDERKWRGK